MEELEIGGLARIHSIEPCPPIADGEGSVVTGRFLTRRVARITRIEFQDELGRRDVLEGTPIHPIWSLDREAAIAQN